MASRKGRHRSDIKINIKNEWSFTRLFITIGLAVSFLTILFTLKSKKEPSTLSGLTETQPTEPTHYAPVLKQGKFDADGFLKNGQVEHYPVVSMSTNFVDGSGLSLPYKKLFTGTIKNYQPTDGHYHSFYSDDQEIIMTVENSTVISIVAKNLKCAGGRYNGTIDSKAKPVNGSLIPGKEHRFFSPFYQEIVYKNGLESEYVVRKYPYQNAQFDGILKRDGDYLSLFDGKLYARESMQVLLPAGFIISREAFFKEGYLVTGEVKDFKYLDGIYNGCFQDNHPIKGTIQSAQLDPAHPEIRYSGGYDEEGNFDGIAEKQGFVEQVIILLNSPNATDSSLINTYSR